MPFFLSTVNPNSLVMMMLPGITLGQKPSVNASVSESVAGSTSQEAALLVVVAGGAIVVVAFGRTMVDADAALEAESYVDLFAMVVKVYAVPLVRPVMVHDPDAPVTVQVAPPGVAVTRYEVGVRPPVGGVTVIVALSSPATTVGTPGAFGSGRAPPMLLIVKVKEA
jgi:uncharacterized membrane protein